MKNSSRQAATVLQKSIDQDIDHFFRAEGESRPNFPLKISGKKKNNNLSLALALWTLKIQSFCREEIYYFSFYFYFFAGKKK